MKKYRYKKKPNKYQWAEIQRKLTHAKKNIYNTYTGAPLVV